MTIHFTVTYPKVDRAYPYAEAQRDYYRPTWFDSKLDRTDVLDLIFAKMGNVPSAGMWFPWFRSLQTRSMSVGDVVRFADEPTAYICDTCGWLHVSWAMAQSWLNFKRQYGCDMFELKQWKRAVGLDK